ncbi:hypothetical protein [Streptomyces camelliae]|uniref:Uncharacterized protein n=1 Tax=Streptomyces camelliae TaxID=3004093 RepID=A0ABY7NWC8_9ACTN|nr:hypothetical protein [Streptomyces sp. HUAS 2-6]WBO61630.1 hypothetical protein O1G22_01490 [Streptomyces sp. HUAS 2-6]
MGTILSGRLMPPKAAVEALAAVTGTDPALLMALHETAADSWQRDRPLSDTDEERGVPDRDSVGDHGASGHEPLHMTVTAGPVQRPVTRPMLYLTAAASALAGAAIAVAVLTAVHGQSPTASPRTAAVARPIAYACKDVRKDGAWHAGNSDTSSDTLEVDMSGPEVAELRARLVQAQGPTEDAIVGAVTDSPAEPLRCCWVGTTPAGACAPSGAARRSPTPPAGPWPH